VFGALEQDRWSEIELSEPPSPAGWILGQPRTLTWRSQTSRLNF
jgi:hypothetical protein